MNLDENITYSTNIAKMPIGDIVLPYGKYKPCEDITTYELAKLLHLLVVITAHYGVNALYFDIDTFIIDNKLERHFERS